MAQNKRISRCVTFELFGFTILNGRSSKDTPAKFTFVGRQGSSVIDVAWANDYALTHTTNFEILYSRFASDHFPCVITMKTKYEKSSQKSSPQNIRRIKWNQQKVDNYKASLNYLHANPAIAPTITEIVQHIGNTAKDLGMEKFTSSKKSQITNPWYNHECQKQKVLLRKAANEFKRDNLNRAKMENFRKTRNKYTDLIRKCRKDHETQLKIKLSNVNDNVTFWKTVKEIAPKKSLTTTLASPNGNDTSITSRIR